MVGTFGHHELFNRYLFEGDLVLETALRTSSGRASPETDAPLIRTRGGDPYIPGSSLRGVIRSEIERMVNGAGAALGLRSCVLFTNDTNPDACLSVSRKKRDKVGQIDDEVKALAYIESELCDVCQLFGSTVYASHLQIDDGLPRPQKSASQSVIRDGVGIDRDTGTARENVKFDFEVLETGPRFGFNMQAENLRSSGKRLVNVVTGLLCEGIHVGGKRAGGLGRIKLDRSTLQVSGFESPESLLSALMKGESPITPIEWNGGFKC